MDEEYEAGAQRGHRAPRYDGEDVTPTSDRELKGWFTYGFAAEVYAVCGVGSFAPICLEQLARGRGVLLADGVTPCVRPSNEVSAVHNATRVLHALIRDEASKPQDNTCVVHLFGTQINTASVAMYTFSAAVLLQALVVVSFSSMADYGSNRKSLLITFGLTGAVASMLFLIVSPSIYLVGSLLVMTSVTCLGSSFVLLNSYLPTLAAHHPSITSRRSDTGQSESMEMEQGPASPNDDQFAFQTAESKESTNQKLTPEMQLSSQISAKGVGIGYAAAVFVQILSILILFLLSKTSLSPSMPLRLVLFFVGSWWFTFTLVSGRWLRDRPGPPLNASFAKQEKSWRSLLPYIKFAWVSLWRTIKLACKLRQVIIFLMAWFLLSDSVATVSSTAIMFAKTELQMATVSVACLSILSTLSGMLGAFAWPRISRRFGMKSKHTIVACVVLFETIPIYGLMGYIPIVQRWGVGGIQQSWEIFPLGFVHGFVMGGISSYCRSFFGQLIPPGSEAAFFALYAVTDKGSSVFGPAIVGRIVDITGHLRPAFIFLAVLMLLPIPLVWIVNEEKGRGEALAMAEKLKGFKRDEDEMSAFPSSLRGEEQEGLLAPEEE